MLLPAMAHHQSSVSGMLIARNLHENFIHTSPARAIDITVPPPPSCEENLPWTAVVVPAFRSGCAFGICDLCNHCRLRMSCHRIAWYKLCWTSQHRTHAFAPAQFRPRHTRCSHVGASKADTDRRCVTISPVRLDAGLAKVALLWLTRDIGRADVRCIQDCRRKSNRKATDSPHRGSPTCETTPFLIEAADPNMAVIVKSMAVRAISTDYLMTSW